jgi:hypothetical protein
MMKRTALFSLVVMGALAYPIPVAHAMSPVAQDRAERRVYDREHKDYHVWSTEEDRSYRGWLGSNHIPYRDVNKLKRAQQQEYWRWRHDHPNGDGGR